MTHALPKLHNAMWPGLVGKGTGDGQEPPISLERMLELTAAATVNGEKFDGIDYFLFLPHTDPDASDAELHRIAELIASYGFSVGSLVAPVWLERWVTLPWVTMRAARSSWTPSKLPVASPGSSTSTEFGNTE